MASADPMKSNDVDDDGAGTEASEDGGYDPKVRWVIPHLVDKMTFLGKDILVVAYDIYITFYNLKNNTEIVYAANSEEAGDGVEVIAAHKAYIFAFAEKIKHARILVVTYPKFEILAELKDMDANRYKGLCMMENDLVAAFCGFPNYLMSVWSWRTQQRLISVPTGTVRRSQIYMSSRTHMLVCQCWGGGLNVWEVALCYKRCFMMKRTKKEVTGWEVSEPKLIGVCWSTEGQLYAIDKDANLYIVLSDGIGMVTSLEWSEECSGAVVPRVCTFLNGILLYCPDNCLRWLKKADNKWKVVFSYVPREPVIKLVSNSLCDVAAMWTENGLAYRLTAEAEDKLQITALFYKQRHIKKIQMIAPDFKYLITINDKGTICIYEILSGKMMLMKHVEGEDISFECSPVEQIICIFGCFEENYSMCLYRLDDEDSVQLTLVEQMCLTHQIVSRIVFSNTGAEIIAAAMAAGHIFILNLSKEYKLSVVRYAELGRGLADCLLMQVGPAMRAFSLVLYSDKYCIGERIIAINATTGKDNKFAGKMQGPYSRILPLAKKDHVLAIPHLSRHYHVCKLGGEKGVTVSVKIDAIIEVGHDIKQFDGFYIDAALLTFGFDGKVILRKPDAREEYDLRLIASHRYEMGIKTAVVDSGLNCIATLAENLTVSLTMLRNDEVVEERPLFDVNLLEESGNTLHLNEIDAKNYLERQEEKKVREEAMDFKVQREEVVRGFELAQEKLVELLEENIAEVPLHQLSLAEFNLHLEHKKERNKQAEKEREDIRLNTEARIAAQDKVTLWIKHHCWDTIQLPRVKLFAIFSHYHVENYAVLPPPYQLPTWLELQQTEALRTLEMENDDQLFRPWDEHALDVVASLEQSVAATVRTSTLSMREGSKSTPSQMTLALEPAAPLEEEEGLQPHVLEASKAHSYVPLPPYAVPQTLAFSFMQMGWQQHVVKLNNQNMRLWFNKQFEELMTQKKREVGLVMERNARLRFIIEELNKLSDLRGSFHHLIIPIHDPQWRQEEEPIKLIKVEPEECDIEPYVSPSQVVIPPPEPQPKDDFKERALMEMMDGVLEKLWHEEIKKPIPMPQCMLDKEPEQFNEEDLRQVFDYEAKVQFRNEERDKYRKMLHAEYAKLSQLLNEGVVKFNQRVKETWLLKLRVDSIIGQESLSLLRLRRTNLDRVENAEKMEEYRAQISVLSQEIETLTQEQQLILEQSELVQSSYDALQAKDRLMERTFRNNFADLSSIIVDQCYKFYRKRPKWQQRATMTPVILYELGLAILSSTRPSTLHADCVDYYKAVEVLDQISNMPPVMDEGLWASMVRLRRQKIENEIRMRGVAQEMAYVESAVNVWTKAIQKRSELLQLTQLDIVKLREHVEQTARNKTIQLVLPAGQVEILTSGHMEDFSEACLILREEIEQINAVILKVGELKLRMMRKQMEFRRGILAKEWEHAQMKMKLRHMEAELYSYRRLKIPKELQLYLKNKTLGYTEEMEFVRLEKEMEASKMSVNHVLMQQIRRVEELQLKINALEKESQELEKMITKLNMKVSEKRIREDPLEPIRIRCVYKNRMETLVLRSQLIREVQANHTTIVRLQTELELRRLRTYPTLASFTILP